MTDQDPIAQAYEALATIREQLNDLEGSTQTVQQAVAGLPTPSDGLSVDELGPDEDPAAILVQANAYLAQLRGALAQAHFPLNDAHNLVSRLGLRDQKPT